MHFPQTRRSPARQAAAIVLGLTVLAAAFLGLLTPADARPEILEDFPLYAALTPDDTFYMDQWGLRSVNAPQAWDVTLGSPNVTVAVIDTGVWWNHQDINPNMWQNTDGTYGYDFIDGDTNPVDEDVAGGTFHGTGVAGVIAAVTNNGRAIAGAAQVRVMALRALGPNGEGSSFNASQAIRWAVNNGAWVINLSLGTNNTFIGPSDLQMAIDEAWRSGALIVAAAGNSGEGSLDFPARLPNVMAVAALDETGSRASYSNYGTGLDFSAPGTRILTLTSGNQIHYLSGTSLAAPFVSAAAALLWSMEPALTNVDVWNILNDTADRIGSGYNTDYGWGEVNFWSAINALNRPFISVNSFPGKVARSAPFDIGWTILGPAGLPVTDTHIEWGTRSGVLGNATSAQTGMTRDSFSVSGLSMPEGATAFYFRVIATVNGTRYESPERTIVVSNLPDFVQILYDLFAGNLLYLALFVLALAAIVAFIPQRRARARRTAYYARPLAPPTHVYGSPPPGPPSAPPGQPLRPTHTPRPLEPIQVRQVQGPASPETPSGTPSAPPTQAPPSQAHASLKKRCPECGTSVGAENLFCFFCGHPFR